MRSDPSSSRSSPFPATSSRATSAPALARLVDSGTIRILDLAFVTKDADGNAAAFEDTDLDPEPQAASSISARRARRPVQRRGPDRRRRGLGPTVRPPSSSGRTCGRREVAPGAERADGVLFASTAFPHEVVVAAGEWPARQPDANLKGLEFGATDASRSRTGPAWRGTAVIAGRRTAGRESHHQQQNGRSGAPRSTRTRRRPNSPAARGGPCRGARYAARAGAARHAAGPGILTDEEFGRRRRLPGI